jgi:Family of unknown function (DUF6339)
MKILNKLGHREASMYLVDTCKGLSLGVNKSVEGLSLVSSDSLCAKVGAESAWWRDASAAIKPMKFDPEVAIARLSELRLVEGDKSLSDYRASLAIYDALRELPAIASVDWTLWSGLAFGACSEYMKARWHVPAPIIVASGHSPAIQDAPDEYDSEDEVENKPKKQRDPINRARGILLQRWIGRGAGTTALTRHGVGRLWWIARVADMASRESKFINGGKSMKHYLRILYADQNIQWSIVLRRYGAMTRLVSVLLDKIASDYLDLSGPTDRPFFLAKGKSIDEVKRFTKLLNTSAGGSLYDLKDYEEMKIDVDQFQGMSVKPYIT